MQGLPPRLPGSIVMMSRQSIARIVTQPSSGANVAGRCQLHFGFHFGVATSILASGFRPGYHPPPMDSRTLTLSAFQKHIFDKYEKVDRARGTPKTFLWFIEEVGELATALHGDDRDNLAEEFADVLAWLCTLANINDIDLADAVTRKYLGKRPPKGHK